MTIQRGQQRSMPALTRIVDYWAADSNAAAFPNLVAHALGWREPFCFRCGWFTPIPDIFDQPQPVDAWKYATGWLERAHLAERSCGGSDRVDNLVPLCSVCHRQMPVELDTRDAAITWINGWDPDSRNPFWQAAADLAWAGDNYSPCPGTKAVLNLRLHVDDFHRRALIEARQFAATTA